MARSFNGVDQYFDFGTAAALNLTGAQAYSFFVRFPNASFDVGGAVFATGDIDFLSGRVISVDGSASPRNIQVTGTTPLTHTEVLDGDSWHHVCVNHSAGAPGTTDLYVDGALHVSQATLLSSPAGVTKYIGAADFAGSVANFINGYLADIAVWSRALTALEIILLSKRAQRPDSMATSLVGWWKLEETVASDNAADSSGNALHGTQHGSPPNPDVAPVAATNRQPMTIHQLAMGGRRRPKRRR